jgi:formylmethanofuran dehydrogenase subunit E
MFRESVLAVGLVLCGVLAAPAVSVAHDGPIAETPADERDLWISLGARIHGGFGSLIAVGIRIGDDARQRLQAQPRELDVTYYNSPDAPCPCIVDGVMIATRSSPGTSTLRVSDTPSGAGQFGRVVIRHKPSGRALEYVVPARIWPTLRDANKDTSGVARWNSVMKIPEPELFARHEANDGAK